VQVRVLQLQNLVNPMHELDIRIATHFAEYSGAFDAFVAHLVELSE
jgi:hypothetical protein